LRRSPSLASGAVVLVVNPETEVHSVAELIALAKSKPGQVLHATVVGSLPHLASELFAQRAGIKLMQVPYQGSPQGATIKTAAWSFRERTYLRAGATNAIVPLTKKGGNHKGTT